MSEIVLSLVFLVLLAACLDPLHLLMPTPLQMLALSLLTVAGIVYAGLIFRERPRDEREALHVARSSRGGYLAGVIGLSAVVIVRMLQGSTDKTAIAVLGAMVIVRLLLLLWNRTRS
jgi:hypothetical protein